LREGERIVPGEKSIFRKKTPALAKQRKKENIILFCLVFKMCLDIKAKLNIIMENK
jgi:hypothetical protein